MKGEKNRGNSVTGEPLFSPRPEGGLKKNLRWGGYKTALQRTIHEVGKKNSGNPVTGGLLFSPRPEGGLKKSAVGGYKTALQRTIHEVGKKNSGNPVTGEPLFLYHRLNNRGSAAHERSLPP